MGRTKNPEPLGDRVQLRMTPESKAEIERERLRTFPEMEFQDFLRYLIRLGAERNAGRTAAADRWEAGEDRSSGGGAAELKGKTEAAG